MRLLILTALSLPLLANPALAAKPRVTTVRESARVLPPVARVDPGQPACVPPSETDPAAQMQTVDAIEQGFPEEYRGTGRIGRVPIAPDEMRSLVTMFACVGAWPAAHYRMTRLATPLFASRHGRDAFAMLDAIAKDRGSDAHLRASARTFYADMTYRVWKREPI